MPFYPKVFRWLEITVLMKQVPGLNWKYHKQQELPAFSLGHHSLTIDLQQNLFSCKDIKNLKENLNIEYETKLDDINIKINKQQMTKVFIKELTDN